MKPSPLRLEILPLGTVEREARLTGARIYQLEDLPRLIEELRRAGAAGTASGGEQLGLEEAPQTPSALAGETKDTTHAAKAT